MNNVERYQRIVNELVRKSFPELKGKKIFIFEFNSKKYFGMANKLFFIRSIGFSKISRKFSEKEIKEIIVHELSYLEIFEKRNFWQYFLIGLKYWFDKKLRIREENEAIKYAIKKGYGKESYCVSVRQLKNPYRKKINKFYLLPRRIKRYAKKIREW